MFTIPFATCFVATCSVLFGVADWTKDYSGHTFQLGYYRVVLKDMQEQAAGKELRKIIGNNQVLCAGVHAMHRNFIGDCYINGKGINEYASVTKTLHERGF